MKFIATIIAIILLASVPCTALAEEVTPTISKAEMLKELGLIKGSNNGFELERTPSRIEGGIMLIRLLGKESAALEKVSAHPFTDVPSWADHYVGYLYSNKLTNGIESNKFGTGLIDAKSYVTFVIRALGYSEKDSDFTWSSVLEKAAEIGLISKSYRDELNKKVFLRDDMIKISFDALAIKFKGSQNTLLEKLIAEGAVKEETAKKLDLVVTQGDPNSILSIEMPKATINEKSNYRMPQEVSVKFGDNTVRQVPVKWEKSSIDTTQKGTYAINGQLVGYAENVTLTVDIIDYVIEGSIKNYKSKEPAHFIAYYTDNESSIIDEVLKRLEENYDRITKDLNVQQMPKVELSIYPNLREYHKTITNYPGGTIPTWSVGSATSDRAIKIVSPINTSPSSHNYEDMLEVVVHEFTHSVAQVINYRIGSTARWLSEGIARMKQINLMIRVNLTI